MLDVQAGAAEIHSYLRQQKHVVGWHVEELRARSCSHLWARLVGSTVFCKVQAMTMNGSPCSLQQRLVQQVAQIRSWLVPFNMNAVYCSDGISHSLTLIPCLTYNDIA